jgi:hypothetical protein
MIDTAPRSQDEFYIGYEERMAPGIASRIVRAVAIFAGGAAVSIAVWLLAQQSLPAARFEFGVVRRVEGVLRREPYPSLDVDGRRVWLVGPGKFGADQLLNRALSGSVVLEGSAIQRGHTHMLEVSAVKTRSESTPNAFSVNSTSTPNGFRVGSESRLHAVRLTGEIVDSKCFLGVMSPGEGTVHRDCARRCLSGGIPPMLVVRDGRGREELVVLVSSDGKPVGRALAAIAGRPISLTGRLVREGDQYVLYANGAGGETFAGSEHQR